MHRALQPIWQKERARRDLLLGGLPGRFALHPSPSPDNSIQLTRQEAGVLSRPAAKKATFPSGEKTRLETATLPPLHPSPPPPPLSGVLEHLQLKHLEEDRLQTWALKRETLIKDTWSLGKLLLLQLELQARRGQRSHPKDPGTGQSDQGFTTKTSNFGYSLNESFSSTE